MGRILAVATEENDMKADTTLEEFKKALGEVGVKDLDKAEFHSSLAKFQKGGPLSLCIDDERLGRCYNRMTYVTLNGTEKDVPTGNFGNHRILAKGEHALLGAWIKSSCEYDSSD